VMVVDRRGIHRAHKLDATLDHYHGTGGVSNELTCW